MRESDGKGIFAQPGFYLALMFLIITAQVFWWLMFFAGTRFALVRVQDELDIVLWKALNGETKDLHAPPYFRRENGHYELDESVIQERRRERDRNLIMLWAEASFFISVFAAGSVILVRLHRKQRRLASERELFLNSFTHELKTPLAAIKLNLQTLRRRPESASRGELIETSLREVEILNRRISEILMGGEAGQTQRLAGGESLAGRVFEKVMKDLSSTIRESRGTVETGWLPPVPRGVKVFVARSAPLPEPVFRGIVAGPERSVSADQVFLRLQKLDELPVRVGELELGFILSGLITNALVHGADAQGSMVSVWFRHRGNDLLICVADRGPGIPWSQRNNIFRPLVRLQQKQQGFLPGTGMGLFNLQELCRRCGGRVRLLPSQTGAIFEVRLPLARREVTL